MVKGKQMLVLGKNVLEVTDVSFCTTYAYSAFGKHYDYTIHKGTCNECKNK